MTTTPPPAPDAIPEPTLHNCDRVAGCSHIYTLCGPWCQVLQLQADLVQARRDLAAARQEINRLNDLPDSDLTCGELSCDDCNTRHTLLKQQRDDAQAEVEQLRLKHDVACATITKMQDEREQRRAIVALSELSSWLGEGMADTRTTSVEEYVARIREGVESQTRVAEIWRNTIYDQLAAERARTTRLVTAGDQMRLLAPCNCLEGLGTFCDDCSKVLADWDAAKADSAAAAEGGA